MDTSESGFPVITTSPSEDHTYSAGPTVPVSAPSSSPDEAYGEGSASEDSYQPPKLYVADWPIAVHLSSRPSIVGATDPEEQRKIAEGADALLNLAGIATRKRTHSCEFTASSPLPVEVPEAPPPQVPKRTIATRGRKRGSSATNTYNAGATASSRQKMSWPAAGRVGKRKSAGDLRRGGTGRRRGSSHHHHNNNNHIHLKQAKTSGSSSMQKNDHELRRPVRSEDKSGRTRR